MATKHTSPTSTAKTETTISITLSLSPCGKGYHAARTVAASAADTDYEFPEMAA